MTLYIDHKPAAVKQGTTFEFRSDNRLFADREDYTLNIELPLHCPENDAIFGMINRKDVDVEQIYFDAEIVCDNFVCHGAVVVTSVTDDLVKVQFIAGRSFQNFYPDWDNTMINELNIGDWPSYDLSQSPRTWWGSTDYIALPWCNNTSGNIQNRADMATQSGQTDQWHTTADSADDAEVVTALSFQIRLYKLTELICAALGYTFEADDWRQSEWYHLYCFNTVPAAWDTPNWQSAMPQWSVNEYFQHLERLLGMTITIDHRQQKVTVAEDITQYASILPPVHLKQIVDEFTLSVSREDESQYMGARNIAYQDAGHHLQNFYSCHWLFKERPNLRVSHFSTLNDLINAMRARDYQPHGRADWTTQMFHVMDTDTYYCLYYVTCVKPLVWTPIKKDVDVEESVYKLMPVNPFGPVVADEQDLDNTEEIGFVPAWIDDAFNSFFVFRGSIVFLECGEQEGVSSDAGEKQPNTVAAAYVEMGSQKGGNTAFSNIAVAFWFGSTIATDVANKLPRPWLDREEAFISWTVSGVTVDPDIGILVGQLDQVTWYAMESGHDASLRLTTHPSYLGMTKIDTRRKYEFTFLFDGMPDTRSIFVIRGKKYLCSQLRAEIDQHGMSRLKKGTFWRIL